MATLPALVIVAWELGARSGYVSPLLLPPLGSVILRLVEDILSGNILYSAGGTLLRLVVSYLTAAVLGVTLGIMMARIRTVRWFLDPIISIGFPAPKISFLPIFVLWFGFFDSSKIALAVFACVFPIIAGTWAGTQSVDKYLIWSAQNLGVRPGAILWKVIYDEKCLSQIIF